MSTHLDRFTQPQLDALALLREAIRHWAMVPPDEIVVPDPLRMAQALVDARTTVALDPELLAECGRQMFTQFDLCPIDQAKRDETLAMYHDPAQMAQWTVIALRWVARVAMALADSAGPPPTKH
jgi:hypothetical protein